MLLGHLLLGRLCIPRQREVDELGRGLPDQRDAPPPISVLIPFCSRQSQR
jgi:hypothetical protein